MRARGRVNDAGLSLREVDVGGVSQAGGDALMSDKESSSNKGMLCRGLPGFLAFWDETNVIPHSSSNRPELQSAGLSDMQSGMDQRFEKGAA
jgi:hypothetical protein